MQGNNFGEIIGEFEYMCEFSFRLVTRQLRATVAQIATKVLKNCSQLFYPNKVYLPTLATRRRRFVQNLLEGSSQ